jgi:hypothetical protein
MFGNRTEALFFTFLLLMSNADSQIKAASQITGIQESPLVPGFFAAKSECGFVCEKFPKIC